MSKVEGAVSHEAGHSVALVERANHFVNYWFE